MPLPNRDLWAKQSADRTRRIDQFETNPAAVLPEFKRYLAILEEKMPIIEKNTELDEWGWNARALENDRARITYTKAVVKNLQERIADPDMPMIPLDTYWTNGWTFQLEPEKPECTHTAAEWILIAKMNGIAVPPELEKRFKFSRERF